MLKSRYKKASSRITRRSKVRKIFGLFIKTGLPTAFLVGLVFVLRADFLQIKNFEILGAETIQTENIKNIAQSLTLGNKLFLIPKSNIFLLNKNNLANVLLANFPRAEKVEINKHFFSQKIELKIMERKGEFLWCSTQDECLAMTKDGFVFEKSSIATGKIIFRGILEGNPLMKNFSTPQKMQNYIKLIETFKNSGFEISSINIESSDKAIAKMNINNAISDVIFNPKETDLSLIAQNAILLIKETQIKSPSAHFQYIDARFGNKMFYKLQ